MKSLELLSREIGDAAENVAWRRPKIRIVAFALLTGLAHGLGACSMDLSCVETATCAPLSPNDGGKDQGTGDSTPIGSSQKDVTSSDGPDVTTDRLVNDVSRADGNDAASLVDGSNDARTIADGSAASDGDAKPPPNPDGGRDVSGDAPSSADANDVDSSTGVDRDSSSPIDVTAEPPVDTGHPSDARSIDAFDSSDVVDACKMNDCGGCTVLTASPGSTCGACGTYACNGMDSVVCANDAGLNACGGCGALAGTPGAKCGTCGTYVCGSDKASVNCDNPDPLKATQLAAGAWHTCALLSSGSVRCWGRNTTGALGNNSTTDLPAPTPDVLTGVTAISAGAGHTCALMGSGGVRCWGHNLKGQLGDGSMTDLWGPPASDITNLSGVSAISCGAYHTCAVSFGNLRCWGYNNYGQLGDGLIADRASPGPSVLNDVHALGTAFFHSCATTGSSLRCWGSNSYGELGDGTLMDRYSPNTETLASVDMIGVGGNTSCALIGGAIRCWGHNSYGQLGDNNAPTDGPAPGLVLLTNVRAVGLGPEHSCAVIGAGRYVKCWGRNDSGQLGSGNKQDLWTPTGPDIVQGAISVVGGLDHTCALLLDGTVKCWGENTYGAVGDGSWLERLTPVELPAFCP